jgi:hypothetical protein
LATDHHPQNGKSFLDDRESLQAIVDSIPDPVERQAYKDFKGLSLESGFPNRKFVIYTLRNGVPTNIELLTLGEFSMDPYTGPEIQVHSGSYEMSVKLTPARFRGRDLFLHVPQSFELRWRGKRQRTDEVHFVPHYAVLIKSRSKPHLHIDGDTYCVRLNQFREMYPDLDVRY